MAIFAGAPGTQTTASVASTATQIYNTSASGLSGTLRDLTVINTGAVTIYLGQSGVTSATGLPLQPGAQITFNGYSYATAAAGGNVYAITASGTSSALAGLATVDSNV